MTVDLNEKLGSVSYKSSEKSHLEPNQDDCKKCQKPCQTVCPAGVYNFDENEQRLIVKYENCLECGACRVICPYQSLKWNYPSGGCGIVYKNS